VRGHKINGAEAGRLQLFRQPFAVKTVVDNASVVLVERTVLGREGQLRKL